MDEIKETSALEGTVVPEIPLHEPHPCKVENKTICKVASTEDSVVVSKAPSLVNKGPKLTNKNRSFLEHLLAGKSTLEAYRLAGYTGKGDAAYVLRLRLKEELKRALEAEGVDRNGLKIRVKHMLELGLDPEVKHLSPKMYLETLRFTDKLLEKEREVEPTITPFIIRTDTVNITEK